MSGQRIAAESSAGAGVETMIQSGVRGKPDVAALPSLDKNRLCVLVWHYHDDDVPGPDAAVNLTVEGISFAKATFRHYRIDQEHSNAFTAWKTMGSPQQPTSEQYAQLEKAGQLAALDSPKTLQATDGRLTLTFNLPRQAVSLLVILDM